MTTRSRADYGIDAPEVICQLLIRGGIAFLVGLGGYFLLINIVSWIAQGLLAVGIINIASQWLFAGLMVWSSRAGKLTVREQLLDTIPWKGNETALDVGCGRGLLLIGAAKRLTTGRAIGIDMGQAGDRSDSSREAALANALAEDVRDRVEARDGDLRQLPFKDATMDVVVSGLALHNLYQRAEREKALREIARVLKPGGHVAIMDIRFADHYAEVFRQNGLNDVKVSRLNWRIFPPVRMVVGKK